MVLLAALVGFPSLGPGLLTHLHRTALQRPASTWREFLGGLVPCLSGHWKNAADARLNPIEAQSWQALTTALVKITDGADQAGIALPQAISEWAVWVVPVGRLSFPACRVVTGLNRQLVGLAENGSTPMGKLAEETTR